MSKKKLHINGVKSNIVFMFLIIYYYLTISYYIENKYIFDIEIEKTFTLYIRNKEFLIQKNYYII